MVGATGPTPRRHLRPHVHLFQQGLLACIAFMAPVFVVLYALTLPNGPWSAVLTCQLVATAIIGFASLAYWRAGIWVDAHGLTERGFFGFKVVVPVEAIGSIVGAVTFEGHSTRTYPQLFVVGHDGRQLIRMRGQFWSRENMDVVVRSLEVLYEPIGEAMSTRELGADYPGLLYWFERHPVAAALVFSTVVGVIGLAIFVILRSMVVIT